MWWGWEKRGDSNASPMFLHERARASFPGMERMAGGWWGDVDHVEGQNGVELKRII